MRPLLRLQRVGCDLLHPDADRVPIVAGEPDLAERFRQSVQAVSLVDVHAAILGEAVGLDAQSVAFHVRAPEMRKPALGRLFLDAPLQSEADFP